MFPNYRLVGCMVIWVLWRINLCRLFDAKFFYIFNQRFLNEYLIGNIFYKQDFIFLHMSYNHRELSLSKNSEVKSLAFEIFFQKDNVYAIEFEKSFKIFKT